MSGDAAGALLCVGGLPLVGVDSVRKHTSGRLLLLLSNGEERRSKNDDCKERRQREASTRRPARAWHGGRRRLRCERRCLGQAVVVEEMGHRWAGDGVAEGDG